MSEDLQLGRGQRFRNQGARGVDEYLRPASQISLSGSVDVLLVAGGGDTVLVDGFSPVGSYRLETYLGELTYLGEPRRTAGCRSYVHGLVQEKVCKPQLMVESMDFILQKADSLYSFVNSYSVRGC